MSSSTDSKLVSNAKEALALVGLCAGVGYLTKKALNKNFTEDPSKSLSNAGEFTLVMLGALYARDWPGAKEDHSSMSFANEINGRLRLAKSTERKKSHDQNLRGTQRSTLNDKLLILMNRLTTVDLETVFEVAGDRRCKLIDPKTHLLSCKLMDEDDLLFMESLFAYAFGVF